MDYVQQILGKPLRLLDYQDIFNYFQTDRTENDFLEFKSCPQGTRLQTLWDGILRTSCAFLNTSGGVVIWGSPMEQTLPNPITGKKERHCLGSLTTIDPGLTKDSIVAKISSSMTPLAGGIQVEILEDPTGNRICVIEIKPSNYAPHQTGNIYHMRLDGQTVAAPHAYVEALIKRVTYPNLEGHLKFYTPSLIHRNAQWPDHYVMNVEVWILNFSPMENEENLFFSISSNHAKPLDRWIRAWTEIRLNSLLDELVGTDVMPVLMNGHPYTKTIAFEIDAKIDVENGTHFNFILKFGGKKSPLKFSRYSLTLKLTDEGRLNWHFTEVSKNKFLSNTDDADGLSREDQLKHFGLS